MNTDKVLALAREADLTRKDLAGKEHIAYEQYITPYLVKFAALIQQQMEAENAELLKDAERQWVGLTDEEVQECVRRADGYSGAYKRSPWPNLLPWPKLLANEIESKLKEKNG